jgi:hypothetical protein
VTLPTFFQGQQNLRNPTYGNTRWERGKFVPTQKPERGSSSSTMLYRNNREFRGSQKVRNRSWIDENTGLFKPDVNGIERSCHKCGGRNHLSFEVEFCDPARSKTHIATRFSTGDSVEDVLLDVLDDQLALEELTELQSGTEHDMNDTDSVAAAFTQAFETRFSNRFENRLSNGEGKDEWPIFPHTQVTDQHKPPPQRNGSNGWRSNPAEQPWGAELSNDRRGFE